MMVATLTYRPVHGSAPPYSASSFTCVADMPHRRRLRSASAEQLDVPTCRRSTIGGRAFPVLVHATTATGPNVSCFQLLPGTTFSRRSSQLWRCGWPCFKRRAPRDAFVQRALTSSGAHWRRHDNRQLGAEPFRATRGRPGFALFVDRSGGRVVLEGSVVKCSQSVESALSLSASCDLIARYTRTRPSSCLFLSPYIYTVSQKSEPPKHFATAAANLHRFK